MVNVFIIFVLALIAWFWFDSLRTRERAIQAAAVACKQMGAQLLDQTVSLESLKPARTRHGRLTFRRIYGFDFSVAGYERRRGRAVMLGQGVEQLQIDDIEGTTIEMQE